MFESAVAVHVLGASKAADFVEASVRATAFGGDSEYWVADHIDGDIAGFVQLRRNTHVAIIDNLHVQPGCQQRGVGTALLRTALNAAGTARVGIDAFEGSEIALRFYRRIGFSLVRTRHWRILPPSPWVEQESYIHNLPQSEVTHAAYGISMLKIETAQGTYRVGRIGQRWFRLASLTGLNDGGLRHALWRLDPNRSIIAVMPREDDLDGTPPYLVAHHLEGSVTDLMSSLVA